MRPDPGLVLGQRAAFDDDSQPLEAFGGDAGIDELIGHLGCLGTGSRREDERVGVVVLGLGDDLERCREVVVGLAGKPDDDVGRHGQIVDGGTTGGKTFEVALSGVAAMHRGQHAIAAGLQRVVQVLAHGTAWSPSPRTSRRACLWGAGW